MRHIPSVKGVAASQGLEVHLGLKSPKAFGLFWQFLSGAFYGEKPSR